MRAKIDTFLEKLLVAFMIVLLLDVLWQIFSRYLNKYAVQLFQTQMPAKLYSFTDELAGFLLVWVALLGAAYATGKKEHLAIELLPSKLSKKNNLRLAVLINALIVVFSTGVLFVGGCWLVYTRFYLGQVSAAMELPVGIVYSIIPISGLFISYYALDDIISVSKSFKKA